VREAGCASEWLELLERESSFLMVMTRKIAEERKGAKNAIREQAV
jgi:hypothetical protein